MSATHAKRIDLPDVQGECPRCGPVTLEPFAPGRWLCVSCGLLLGLLRDDDTNPATPH